MELHQSHLEECVEDSIQTNIEGRKTGQDTIKRGQSRAGDESE